MMTADRPIQLAPEHGVDWYDLELRNRQSGGHFFEPSTMRFFRSRRCDLPRISRDRRYVACVTSEQFEGSDGYKAARRYTVRVFDWSGGLFVREPWGFQRWATRKTAVKKVAEFLAAYDALPETLEHDAVWDWIRAEFPDGKG